MNPRNKIYVITFSGHDYSGLDAFGDEKVFMTRGIIDLRDHRKYDEIVYKYIVDAKETDCLMFSGPTLLCALALKTWIQLHGICKVLIWDMVRRKYNLYIIGR